MEYPAENPQVIGMPTGGFLNSVSMAIPMFPVAAHSVIGGATLNLLNSTSFPVIQRTENKLLIIFVHDGYGLPGGGP